MKRTNENYEIKVLIIVRILRPSFVFQCCDYLSIYETKLKCEMFDASRFY